MTSSDATPIRVVIADDHALYRQSLRLVITLDRDIEVVALASDGLEALDQVRTCRPDVLVIDLQMPKLSGLDAIRAIREQFSTTRILMLTMSEDPVSAVNALLAGADGYITKDASGEEVAEAIRDVHRGDIRLTPAAATTLLAEVGHPTDPDRDDASDPGSARNRRILQLLAGGAERREVATTLGLDDDEVRQRIADLLRSMRSTHAGSG